MRKNDGALTKEEQDLLEALERMPEEEIDTTDIPEVLEVRNPRRGAYYQHPHREITIVLDDDIIEWLESLPAGPEDFSVRIQSVLRAHMAQEAAHPSRRK